ncbi:hypothetical protein SDC9_144011 [bioreactor metagenome]|uniref:Uncharacterized protein n=1 Tax=bioreactor metagenome TaxID=1076179 RepID=A0A645E5Q1_9ZZZZ
MLRHRVAQGHFALGQVFPRGQLLDVRCVVDDVAGGQPLTNLVDRPLIGVIDGPNGRVGNPRFGQGAVNVQHPHQAGPGSIEVSGGQDRAPVGLEPVQNVVGVLPDRLRDHQGSIFRDVLEDLHPQALMVNEAVLLFRIVGVGALNLPPAFVDGAGQLALHLLLSGPGGPIGGFAQVATGYQVDGVRLGRWPLRRLRKIIRFSHYSKDSFVN